VLRWAFITPGILYNREHLSNDATDKMQTGVCVPRLNFVYYIENLMANQKVSFRTEKELQKAVLQEKVRGAPDLEI